MNEPRIDIRLDFSDDLIEIKEEFSLVEEQSLTEIGEVISDEGNISDSLHQTTTNDDRFTTYSYDIPDCWTETQCNNYKFFNRWLVVKDRKLGCKACMIMYETQLKRSADEVMLSRAEKSIHQTTIGWRTCQITYNGRTTGTKQTSLRKKILEHRQTKYHCQAIAREERLAQLSAHQYWVTVKNKLDKNTLISIFNLAYDIVKRKLPFEQFSSFCSSFAGLHNIFNALLTPEKLFNSVLNHIACELRKFMVTRMLSESHKKISIVMHETGIMNKKAALALHFKFHNTGSRRADNCVFFDLLPLGSNSPEEVVISLINCLRRNKIIKEYLRKNVISFIFDEDSKLLGSGSEVSVMLSRQILLFPEAKINYDFDPSLQHTTTSLYASIKEGIKLQSIVFTTSVMADSMFISLSGPSIEYFNATKMADSWLVKDNTNNQTTDLCHGSPVHDNTTKISNDIALAAEAYDEQRLVIDLKSESNSNSHHEADDAIDDSSATFHAATITHPSFYHTDNTDENGVSSVKRRKRSAARRTDTKTNSDDNDTIQKVNKEITDLCACKEDTDRLFLLSLLPFMKQLNSSENLEFRMQIQQLLQKKIQLK